MSKKSIWITRNNGEEIELGRYGAWEVVWENTHESYIQFQDIDNVFKGAKIGIRKVEYFDNGNPTEGIFLRVETLTGTILEGKSMRVEL